MTTFADKLREISKNALDNKKKEKEERIRIREENYKKAISSLMSKYHHVLKKGLLEAASSGKTQFQLVIDDDEDFVFTDAFYMNYIDPSQWLKELLNPDSKFLPLKEDGITRDSFTGLTCNHGRIYFDCYSGDVIPSKLWINARMLMDDTYSKYVYDFSW